MNASLKIVNLVLCKFYSSVCLVLLKYLSSLGSKRAVVVTVSNFNTYKNLQKKHNVEMITSEESYIYSSNEQCILEMHVRQEEEKRTIKSLEHINRLLLVCFIYFFFVSQ